MYFRPGNLWKTFTVKSKISENVNGRYVETLKETGIITGVLAEADKNQSDRMKHRWEQDQHSLTHTLVVRGKADLKKGDFLTLGERAFLVLLNNDIGSLGGSSLVYLEERNDIK